MQSLTPMSSASPQQTPVRICVFTSTTVGHSPAHLDAARNLAEALHEHSIELVYGGGTTGLMGELAKTLVSLGGKQNVHGVIPSAVLPVERPEGAIDVPKDKRRSGMKKWTERLTLASRWPKPVATMPEPHDPQKQSALLSENKYGMTNVVSSLSARKHLMCTLTSSGAPGSGFIALSGGFGTMDELMEMITLRQQGAHRCRICLYNVDGFWDLVLAWMESAIQRGFVREEVRSWIGEGRTGEECVKWLAEGPGFRGFDVLS